MKRVFGKLAMELICSTLMNSQYKKTRKIKTLFDDQSIFSFLNLWLLFQDSVIRDSFFLRKDLTFYPNLKNKCNF